MYSSKSLEAIIFVFVNPASSSSFRAFSINKPYHHYQDVCHRNQYDPQILFATRIAFGTPDFNVSYVSTRKTHFYEFQRIFKRDVFIAICLNERVSVCASYRNPKAFPSTNVACRGETTNKGSTRPQRAASNSWARLVPNSKSSSLLAACFIRAALYN